MRALLRVLGFAGIAVGALAYPAAFLVDRAAGEDLLVVEASDEASVEANRGLWELEGSKKEGVPSIYGTPRGVSRLVLVPADKVLRPKEDPGVAIYLKRAGDHPNQAQTLFYFAMFAAIGGLAGGGGLLFAASRMRKPEAPAATG